MKTSFKLLLAVCIAALFAGCAKESSRVVQTPTVATLNTNYSGERIAVSVGRFNNQSSYNNGVFSDGEDRLGNQAQTILISNLQQTGRFSVLDRTNMRAIKEESAISKTAQNLKGARYVITGDVTEFGRKTTGDHQLFGI